ncbi:Pam3-gp28 family putative phage holin [Phreatobacter sp.]|uniref:Pam3-gp28 family putative phage holin n=1 Tax=Phreatobacter sp. TaxID=1966341 RepID=UPI003F713FC1
MNMEQVWTLLRQALLFAGGILVGKGYLDAETLTAIVGGLLTILTALYGLWKRSPVQIVEAAAHQPGVQKIVAPSLAAETRAPNVTTS